MRTKFELTKRPDLTDKRISRASGLCILLREWPKPEKEPLNLQDEGRRLAQCLKLILPNKTLVSLRNHLPGF